MAKYSKRKLIEKLASAAQAGGAIIEYRTPSGVHPALLNIRTQNFEHTFRVYIWNLSRGGVNRPIDEYRVQTSGIKLFEQNDGESTLILGYWDELEIFVAFDHSKHNTPLGASVSLQVRARALYEALAQGLGTYLKNNEVVVAFDKGNLLRYLMHHEAIHSGEYENATQISIDYNRNH